VSEVTDATREFWETWAENKVTREPEAEQKAERAERPERAERAERAERPERPERAERDGRSRDRGRGRDKADKRPAKKDDDRRAKRDDSKPDEERRSKRDTEETKPGADGNQARLFVSLGKKHGVTAEDLRTLLAGPIGGDTSRIGSVSLRDSHAHVRVPEEVVEAIIAGVHGTLHNDHNVTVERARA